jgi:hypothetical protein
LLDAKAADHGEIVGLLEGPVVPTEVSLHGFLSGLR